MYQTATGPDNHGRSVSSQYVFDRTQAFEQTGRNGSLGFYEGLVNPDAELAGIRRTGEGPIQLDQDL